MINLKRFLNRKKPVSSSPDEKAFILNSIYKDLSHQLGAYKPNGALSSKLKLFQKYNTPQKITSFPSLYLAIEDFLLQQKEYAGKSKQDFREVFLMEYAGIADYHELYAVFLPYDIQKVALSRLFLKQSLACAKKSLGNFRDPYLIEAEKLLSRPFPVDEYSTEIEINQVEKEIFDYASSLQQKLSKSIGHNAMLGIFNEAYTKHFQSYYLLEAFTTIVHLIPEDLLLKEDAQMPSKGQMHKLLKSQLLKLEETHHKLNQEIETRKTIQKNLDKSERLYSAVLHNSQHASIIINQAGEIIRWNTKAEKLFGDTQNLFHMLPKVFTIPLKKTIGGNTLKEMKGLTSQAFDFSIAMGSVTRYFELKISPIFLDAEVLFYCIAKGTTNEVEVSDDDENSPKEG